MVDSVLDESLGYMPQEQLDFWEQATSYAVIAGGNKTLILEHRRNAPIVTKDSVPHKTRYIRIPKERHT